jgi:hypothetical protein
MDNPDTSLDKDHPYLFVQRHLLACEWYYTRITLNRCVLESNQQSYQLTISLDLICSAGNLKMVDMRIPRMRRSSRLLPICCIGVPS